MNASYGFHLNNYSKEIKKDLVDSNCKLYQCFIKEYNDLILYQPELKPIIHCSFYINLSSPNLKYTYYQLQKEIRFCLKHNIKYYVLHVGKCGKKLKLPKSDCINNMLKVLKKICLKMKLFKKNNFNLCLELLAGDNNDILYTIEDLNKTLFTDKHFYFKNLKICLDTCHLFASGVHLETIENINEYLNDFDKTIGLNKIEVIHLNNSVFPFDSKKDQHADFDKGTIPLESMIYLFNLFTKHNKNIIIELKNYKHNLSILKNEIKQI